MGKSRKYSLSEQSNSGITGYGFLCDEPDYRICWLLNRWGSLGLARVPDLMITSPNASIAQAYSSFDSLNEEGGIRCRLLANRSKEGIWLTKFSQVDYVLIFQDRSDPLISLLSFHSTIRDLIPEIRGVFELTPEAVSNLL